MKRKFLNAKNIIIGLVSCVLIGASATGVTIFLKDRGEAEAAQDPIGNLPITGQEVENTVGENSDIPQDPSEIPEGPTTTPGEETTRPSTPGTTTDTEEAVAGITETIIERDRTIETYDLNLSWTTIALSSVATNGMGIYKPNLEIEKTAMGIMPKNEEEIISLENQADNKTLAKVGDIIFYEIKVSNTGNYKATNIVVTDLLDVIFNDKKVDAGNELVKIDVLEAGKAAIIKVAHEVTERDLANAVKNDGNIINTAVLTYKEEELTAEVPVETKTHYSYTVEHYTENLDGSWNLEETDSIENATYGAVATYEANTYTGFTFNDELTVNKGATVPADDSLIIKLYYERNNNYSYTVEHYTENLDGSWNLEETDTIENATYGAVATYEANTYTGFTFNDELTVNKGATVPADDSLIIKLYYERNMYGYTVEHLWEGFDGKWEKDENEFPDEDYTALYGAVIDTYTACQRDGYILSHVTPQGDSSTEVELTITENAEQNIISIYYVRNNFNYRVKYYKDSISQANYVGQTNVVQELFGTVINDTIVTADFGANWKTAKLSECGEGYELNEGYVTYTTIQANDNNVVTVIYTKKTNIPYEIRYYYNEVENPEFRIQGTATYGDSIQNEVVDMSNVNGITWTKDEDKSTTLPFIIGLSSNIIEVYYVRPDITVNKTSSVSREDGTVQPGEAITYTIKATNKGYLAGTVKVNDIVPNGTTLTGEIIATGLGTITAEELETGVDLPVPAKTANGNGIATITFTVTVNADALGEISTITNTAQADGDDTETTENPVQKTVSVIKNSSTLNYTNSNIVLVIDTSLSMSYVQCSSDYDIDFFGGIYVYDCDKHDHRLLGDGNGNTALYHRDETMINAAKTVAKELVDSVNLSTDGSTLESTITVIQFDNVTRTVGTATKASDVAALKNNIDAIETDSSTMMAPALTRAKELLPNNENQNIVIFLSDGEPTDNDYQSVINAANSLKQIATVYSIGFGSEADEATLKQIATDSGKYYSASANLDSLTNIFYLISEDVNGSEPSLATIATGELKLEGLDADKVDATHPIIVNDGTEHIITSLTDATIVQKEDGYYLDLTQFNVANDITVTYFSV